MYHNPQLHQRQLARLHHCERQPTLAVPQAPDLLAWLRRCHQRPALPCFALLTRRASAGVRHHHCCTPTGPRWGGRARGSHAQQRHPCPSGSPSTAPCSTPALARQPQPACRPAISHILLITACRPVSQSSTPSCPSSQQRIPVHQGPPRSTRVHQGPASCPLTAASPGPPGSTAPGRWAGGSPPAA